MKRLFGAGAAVCATAVLLTACETVTPRVASTISVTPSSVNLLVGETANLQTTVRDQHGEPFSTLPEGLTVSLSSSNTSVVTVSGMQITAVGAGTSTVTVTAGNASAQVPVTVGNAPTSIHVSPSSLSMTVGQSAGLTVTILDQDGNPMTNLPPGFQVAASSQSTSVAAVDGLTVHAVGTGSTTINVTAGSLTPVSVPVSVGASFPGCAQIYSHTFGTTVSANLTTSDCGSVNRPGRYAKFYELTLQSSRDVRIDMMSDTVDSYLYLWTTGGALLASDDDGGAGLNSRIDITLGAGSYLIEATTWGSGEVGPFQLRTQEGTGSTMAYGSMSFDYTGAFSGTFDFDETFPVETLGSLDRTWAYTVFDPEWNSQDLVVWRTNPNGTVDVVFLFAEGGEVTSPGQRNLEADGVFARAFNLNTGAYEALVEITGGTAVFTSVTADRLGGTFVASGVSEAGSGVTITDGSFDLPVLWSWEAMATKLPTGALDRIRALMPRKR